LLYCVCVKEDEKRCGRSGEKLGLEGGGASEASKKMKAPPLLLLLSCGRSGQNPRAGGGASQASTSKECPSAGEAGRMLGLSGGDPPNPPCGRRGSACVCSAYMCSAPSPPLRPAR
jgi:hypothetical protein